MLAYEQHWEIESYIYLHVYTHSIIYIFLYFFLYESWHRTGLKGTREKKISLLTCEHAIIRVQYSATRHKQQQWQIKQRRSLLLSSFKKIIFFLIFFIRSLAWLFTIPAKKFQSANLVASNYYTYNFSYVKKWTKKKHFFVVAVRPMLFFVLSVYTFRCKGIVKRISSFFVVWCFFSPFSRSFWLLCTTKLKTQPIVAGKHDNSIICSPLSPARFLSFYLLSVFLRLLE